jgi:peptidoglycan/xylan/chitin deacetylase (PgdA/CDA1 family)
MYHRIDDDPEDPYSLCVSPDRFEAQLRTVSETAQVVDLDHLTAVVNDRARSFSARGRTRPARAQVALTFDDGYADNLLAALPVAEALGTPMTVYVATAGLGSSAGYWWDRLALLLHGRQEVELDVEIADQPLHISLRGEDAAATALVALHTRLRLQAVADIEAALVVVAAQLSAPMPEPKARVMTSDELQTLAASPLVTIGAHTVDHVLLSGRPLAEQIETMAKSKSELESLLDRPVRHFAYPYGDGEAFDAVSVEAARQCGFETATTTLSGRVTRLNDRWRLPRRMVRDWNEDEMAARLWAWRAA